MSHIYIFCFMLVTRPDLFFFFFFNDTATTEIYTLSLHDALPISPHRGCAGAGRHLRGCALNYSQLSHTRRQWCPDRKSTRLNSSHLVISYAVFCLKKKKNNNILSQR